MSYFKSIFHQMAKRTAPDAVTLNWLEMIFDTASDTAIRTNSSAFLQHNFLVEVLKSPFDAQFTPKVVELVLIKGTFGEILVADHELDIDDQMFASHIQSIMPDIQREVLFNPGYIQRLWEERQGRRNARRDLVRHLRRVLRESVDKSRISAKKKKEIRDAWKRSHVWTKEKWTRVDAAVNDDVHDDMDDLQYTMDHDGSFTDAVARVDHLLYVMESFPNYEGAKPRWSSANALPYI